MTDRENTGQQPEVRSRAKSDSSRFFPVLLLVTALLTAAFYVYDKSQKDEPLPFGLSDSVQKIVEAVSDKKNDTASNNSLKIPLSDSDSPPVAAHNSFHTPEESVPRSIEDVSAQIDTEPPEKAKAPATKLTSVSFDVAPYVYSATGSQTVDYEILVKELNDFYRTLDSRPYMTEFKLGGPSKTHFSKLIQKLLDNPPVVTRETDDLFTLLKNTAHFFRILGKDNILVLKGILDRERVSFEDILKTFYTLTYSPEHLKNEYDIALDQRALHDYAAFFLHTMGGRLYLFRRDSNSRLAVSFYAILIIDRANDSGDSPHGIDIRPPVNALIEEIENGGKNLKMRDEYLDKLYSLQEKYNTSN